MKLDDEIVELEELDAVRVPPGTWRGYEAGPESLEILVIGAPNLGEAPRGDVDGQRNWWATSTDQAPSRRREARRATSPQPWGSGFESFWEPFTFGVGPGGQAFDSLDEDQKAALRQAIRAQLPSGSFSLDARSWYATATP